jgi:hypothetical protein
MRVWIFAWVLASVITLVVLGAFLASMVSSMLQVGRAAQRFQDEVGGLAADISRGASRAGDHTAEWRGPDGSARP